MGRAPCCDKANVKRGPWSPEEDAKLKDYIHSNGTGGNWIALPQKAGLKRCGKSCRLRWLNYLRPNIKHGEFSDEEDRVICSLFAAIGSRWSIIAGQLPGRTDNDIKNYWNTKLKKKLMKMSSSSIVNPNPPLMSPESSNNIISIPFVPSPTLIPNNYYYNAPTEGFWVNPPPMQNDEGVFVGACTSQNSSNSLSCFGETPGLMGYGGLEEIKQLISPNAPTSFGNYFDESKVMMYYSTMDDLMYVD